MCEWQWCLVRFAAASSAPAPPGLVFATPTAAPHLPLKKTILTSNFTNSMGNFFIVPWHLRGKSGARPWRALPTFLQDTQSKSEAQSVKTEKLTCANQNLWPWPTGCGDSGALPVGSTAIESLRLVERSESVAGSPTCHKKKTELTIHTKIKIR